MQVSLRLRARRAFYKVSGDKKLFAKFERSSSKCKFNPPPPIQINNSYINIEHHNEFYIFANSVVLPHGTSGAKKDENCEYAYDIVTDQRGTYLTKSPIKLNTMSPDKVVPFSPREELSRQSVFSLSRPTPKFTVSPTVAGKRRFLFLCEAEGLEPQVASPPQSCHAGKGSSRLEGLRSSETPSVTEHVENPCTIRPLCL